MNIFNLSIHILFKVAKSWGFFVATAPVHYMQFTLHPGQSTITE